MMVVMVTVAGLTEKMLPLLHKSESPRIVNVCSQAGRLDILRTDPSKKAEFGSAGRGLTRDRLFELMADFQQNVKAGRHNERGWPSTW